MLRTALRPAIRSLPRQAKAFSSSNASGQAARSLGAAAALVAAAGMVGYGYYADRRTLSMLAKDKGSAPSVRDSVLDQPSLKEPIHKRGATSEGEVAPGLLKRKEHEAEHEQQSGEMGAFNEETGEINWDCPCLGGMAEGPCGEQFKAAFSCFVFSEAEPKGMDCVEKFKGMQDCFRQHPDIYGEEIAEDEEVARSASDEKPKSPLPNPNPRQPPPPGSDPPSNSPVIGVTPETTPGKGIAKLVPDSKRYDKASNSPFGTKPEGEEGGKNVRRG